MHANQHHVRRQLEEQQRQRDMHHNIAEAGETTNNRRPWFLTRLWRRLRG
jgi:demethoxyubiquinone hydroxylase (CLK1/Coq7/Cat5 family)